MANKPPGMRLLVSAATVVVGVRLGLWLLPFGFLRRLTGALAKPQRRAIKNRADAATVSRAIMIVSRVVPRATCLTQALAAQVLLGRRGFTSHLRIGVGNQSGAFRAHAWLEDDCGEILVGHADRQQFVLLPSIETAAAA
jgi:hypothetical protein